MIPDKFINEKSIYLMLLTIERNKIFYFKINTGFNMFYRYLISFIVVLLILFFVKEYFL
jgi:hypothetical protein